MKIKKRLKKRDVTNSIRRSENKNKNNKYSKFI